MKVITPIDTQPNLKPQTRIIFLAGGISGCRDWQSETIKELENLSPLYNLSNVLVINPRHPNFDVENPDAEIEQIRWEHKWLECCDLVSYFFDNSESLQPITLYELGKWANKKLSVITVCHGYKRERDVMIQTALDGLYCGIYHQDEAVAQHARAIVHAIKNER